MNYWSYVHFKKNKNYLILDSCQIYCLTNEDMSLNHVLSLIAGAVGYMGTSAFVRKIYTNVKID